MALDRFDKIQDKLDLSRSTYQQLNITKDGHWRKYDYLRGKIVNWLAGEPIYKEELKFLKVNIYKIPQEIIQRGLLL